LKITPEIGLAGKKAKNVYEIIAALRDSCDSYIYRSIIEL